MHTCLTIFFKRFIYIFERQRERAGGGAEVEREAEPSLSRR